METVITTNSQVIISERDVKIVQLYSDGFKAYQIAKRLKISSRTVEAVLNKLRDKYKAKTVTHLVAVFLRNNLIK